LARPGWQAAPRRSSPAPYFYLSLSLARTHPRIAAQETQSKHPHTLALWHAREPPSERATAGSRRAAPPPARAPLAAGQHSGRPLALIGPIDWPAITPSAFFYSPTARYTERFLWPARSLSTSTRTADFRRNLLQRSRARCTQQRTHYAHARLPIQSAPRLLCF